MGTTAGCFSRIGATEVREGRSTRRCGGPIDPHVSSVITPQTSHPPKNYMQAGWLTCASSPPRRRHRSSPRVRLACLISSLRIDGRLTTSPPKPTIPPKKTTPPPTAGNDASIKLWDLSRVHPTTGVPKAVASLDVRGVCPLVCYGWGGLCLMRVLICTNVDSCGVIVRFGSVTPTNIVPIHTSTSTARAQQGRLLHGRQRAAHRHRSVVV